INWNDAAEDLLLQVLGQTPYPVREATEAQLRGVAKAIADDEGKQRVGVETVILAWVRCTPRSVRAASRSAAPGSGRTESAWARDSSWCAFCSMAMSASDRVRPVSRSRADTNSPPLIPIRRWIRHTDRSMSSRDSAPRQAMTCW